MWNNKHATFFHTSKFIFIPLEIYAKVQQNAAIKASPAVVHFEGIEVGKKFTAVVSLCNVAREVVRLHIIPPQTSAFSIKYTKGERLVPGMTMTCKVEFTADEYRYYYDAIRIHCPVSSTFIDALVVFNFSIITYSFTFTPLLGRRQSDYTDTWISYNGHK